jgi:type I restriction enzyme S subunit
MSSFKPYPEYKDSNQDWLGDIPSHWGTINGQFLFKIINEKSKTGEELLLSVSEKKGVTPRSEANVTMFLAESYKGYKLCKPGDLVINSMWAWSNGLGFSKHEGIISTAYSVYRPNHNLLDHRFYNYLLKTERYVGQYEINSKGIWTSRLMLSDWAFLRMPILLPPKPEQTAIANFLDSKTAEIQAFIALKEKTIELLKERKTAIINQVVTKGLDPNVEMKDSGIEWLGQIPKQWEVKKLKYEVSKVGSGVTPSGGASVYVDEGIPLLRSQNIHFDRIDLSDVAFISERIHNNMSGSKVRANDVLLNITGGSIGRCNYVTSDLGEANVNQHVCIIRPKKSLNSQYLNLLLSSSLGQYQVWFYQYGGGREGLNFQNIKGFVFPFPNRSEQLEICKHVSVINEQFDQIISQSEEEITLIKEYQQSLISEAVTGKIDVRNWEKSSKSYATSEAEDKLSLAAEESPQYGKQV